MAANQRPNVVAIHTHDTGRWLGCYGRRTATPNIDRLAAEGMTFGACFSTAPQCSPSRASTLTGLHPHQVGMLGLAHLGWALAGDVVTLPALLRQNGYQACLFGTQHEGHTGSELGYEASFETKMPQRARNVSRVFTEFLAERARTAESRPLFASIGFWETHRPFEEPGEYVSSDPSQVELPPHLPDTPAVREDVAWFEGTLRAADDGVGTVLSALDAYGLEEDTVVIFTTDHGMAFPRSKGTLYDTGTGIALLVRWPRMVAAGSTCDVLVSNVDYLPTICSITKTAVPANAVGRDLLPLLVGERGSGSEAVMSELTWHDEYVPMRSIRTETHKYIRNFAPGPAVYLPLDVHRSLSGREVRAKWYLEERPEEELYDLRSDPMERRNLARSPSAREHLLELRSRLEAWMRMTGDPLLSGPVRGRAAPEWRGEDSPWEARP